MNNFLLIGGITLGSLLLFAGFVHLCTHLGAFGKSITNFLSKAPGLDLVIAYCGVLLETTGLFYEIGRAHV